MSFPARYQLPSFRPYAKAEARPAKASKKAARASENPDLFDKATTADFRAIATALHAEFFAEHPDTEIFTNLVKLLLAKIHDERNRHAGEEYVFQVLQVDGREETATELFARIAPLYETAYAAYIDAEAGDALDPKVFSPERVKAVVKSLQAVALTRGSALHGDVIGAFFEEVLRAGFKQDKGMYFTHSNLVWFIVEAINLEQLTIDTWKAATHPNDRMPYVIDPACGSGTFLLRAMQVMSAAIRGDRANLVATQDDERYFNSHLSNGNPNEWAKDFLYGCDPKFVMAITAKVNMVLHGDGSAHVFKWDSLQSLSKGPDLRLRPLSTGRSVPASGYRHDVCEQFDVVVSNPPFGITLAPETRQGVAAAYSLGASTPSEALFLERWAQLLKPKGRLGVVVPESLLNAGECREARMLLYRFFWIRAVVSLPRNLFIETPTLTSLLFAQKKDLESILAWDTELAAATAAVVEARVQAIADAGMAASASDATVSSVGDAFLAALAPHVDPTSAVVKRGAAAAVMPLVASLELDSATEAVAYYKDLVKTAGFRNLLSNAAFAMTVAAIPQDWPVYAVDEVGFKLSKRGERSRANHLCRFVDDEGAERTNVQLTDAAVRPVIDAGSPSRVLDFIRRDVEWA